MSVSILTYTREATINDGYDLLVKLESFASGLGWTTEIQHDKAWTDTGGGVYDWTTGSYDFLELKSSGYGSQNLVFRFWWDPVTASTRGILYYSLIDPNNPTYDTSSTNPYLQNRVNSAGSWNRASLPDSTFTDGAYFFGNSRFIAVVSGLYSDAVACFAFGLPDLLPEFYEEDEISFLFPQQNYLTDTSAYWWDNLKSNPAYWKGPFGYTDQNEVYNWYQAKVGCGTSLGSVTSNIRTNQDTAPDGDFGNLKYLVRYNAFSDKRVGAQPTIILKNSGTGQWHPCGVLPVILIPYAGLAINGTLTYGSDTYRVFPNTLQSYNYGIAFRTA